MIGNKERPTQGVAVVMLLIGGLLGGRIGAFRPRFRIEELVSHILEGAAMEAVCPTLGFHFHSSRAIPAILRAVVRCQYFELGDRFWIGINVEGGIAAVIHIVAAVEFPVVVLGPTAIHAICDVSINAHLALIRAGLINDARRERYQLSKIAAI